MTQPTPLAIPATVHMADADDRGLVFDLTTLIARRKALIGLGLLGLGAGAAYLALGGGPGQAEPNLLGTAADGSTCLKDPAETAGPFPGDGTNAKAGQTVNVLTQTGIVRRDIRPSFNGMTPVADGVQLDLTVTLVDVGRACQPLVGHAVYLWHCDAGGLYSLYATTDSNYCRGVQITDAKGQVSFTAIFPGCYDGRWPHLHFEVFASAGAAISGDASLLTSQFALPGDVAQALYAADPRYVASIANLAQLTLPGDMIFSDNTPEQLAAMTLTMTGDAAAGFTATGTIGIAV